MENKIAELRKKRKISQQELANAVFVSRQTISNLERGRHEPTMRLAHRISFFFDLCIEKVFVFKKEEKKNESERKKTKRD